MVVDVFESVEARSLPGFQRYILHTRKYLMPVVHFAYELIDTPTFHAKIGMGWNVLGHEILIANIINDGCYIAGLEHSFEADHVTRCNCLNAGINSNICFTNWPSLEGLLHCSLFLAILINSSFRCLLEACIRLLTLVTGISRNWAISDWLNSLM